ncbi:MAG TPA: hypothetical protein VG898_04365 [Solirubrobacterales bacterium]|nr:hypothetical protein [Solirubrobacterales bacterium]
MLGAFEDGKEGEVFVRRQGSGPELLLVHGGASPGATWEALAPLGARWTLVIPYRRGYEPSPPGRQDFDVDAAAYELEASSPFPRIEAYADLK